MIDFSRISLSPSSDISMIVDAELSKCYEKLPDISDMTTDQILQYMQLLYLAKLRDGFWRIIFEKIKKIFAFSCEDLKSCRQYFLIRRKKDGQTGKFNLPPGGVCNDR